MHHHLVVLTALLAATVASGCGERWAHDTGRPSRSAEQPLDAATFRAGLDPDDKRILALVSWFKSHGVTLQSEGSGWWKITQPKISDEFDVVFSIRSFPAWASENQMREALDVNLAYTLNPRAHLAMSDAGFWGRNPDSPFAESDDNFPKLNGLSVTEAVEKLFKEYHVD